MILCCKICFQIYAFNQHKLAYTVKILLEFMIDNKFIILFHSSKKLLLQIQNINPQKISHQTIPKASLKAASSKASTSYRWRRDDVYWQGEVVRCEEGKKHAFLATYSPHRGVKIDTI